MRTLATSFAVLLLATSSMALAQDRQGGGPGGPSFGAGGGGPSIGGGGGPGGGGGDGPGGGASEAPAGIVDRGGPAGGDGPGGNGPSRERAGPSSAEQGPQGDAPAERRASKRDDGPSAAQRKASGDAKPDKSERRARAAEDSDSKSSKKAADKAEKTDKTEANKEQSEANRSTGEDDNKRAETKPSGDKPAKRVDLTGPKRDNVRTAFGREKDFKRHDKSGIHISIGRRLPRDWDYRPVPVAVIEIVPEYRDYVFVYAEDEYVICDPDTYEVVAVVPAGGGGTYAGGSGGSDRCPARLTLSRDERELILDEVRMNNEVDVRDLEVGWSVPSNVELQSFPDEVLSKNDDLDGCRYFVAKDQLAIVDPIEEKVILVIDKG